MWEDLYFRTANATYPRTSRAYWLNDGSKVIIQYKNVYNRGSSENLNFQVLLYPNGKIVIQYESMTGTLNGSTVGIQNLQSTTPTNFLQMAFNSTYIKSNLALQISRTPDWLAVTPQGPGHYGRRQNMDITHPVYLFHAERIIRKLIGRVKDHPAVIGFQVDNETKYYQTCGPNVQLQFVKYMREKFGDLETINQRFGLDYWSNRINSWEDFPSMVGTINGSLGGEFARFQRQLVTDFLAWQAALVNEYKRPDQFVTHNFDLEWRAPLSGPRARAPEDLSSSV